MSIRARPLRLYGLALLLGTGLACKDSTPEPDDGGMGSGIMEGGSTGDSGDGGSSESGPPEAETDADWGECFYREDFGNCAAACAAEGRFCRARGCGDGFTVKGYGTPNCLASFGEAEIGCTEEIMLESTAFTCCCV